MEDSGAKQTDEVRSLLEDKTNETAEAASTAQWGQEIA